MLLILKTLSEEEWFLFLLSEFGEYFISVAGLVTLIIQSETSVIVPPILWHQNGYDEKIAPNTIPPAF